MHRVCNGVAGMKEREIKLSVIDSQPEIFYTLQGEGESVGRPALFVRTSECNLQCVWCDTPNTWNWDTLPENPHKDNRQFSRETEQTAMPVTELVDRILEFDTNRLVLTGGEPMMQQAQLAEMLFLLKEIKPDTIAEVETNGTILPRNYTVEGRETGMAGLVDQWNISPKLSSALNTPAKALKENVLKMYSALDTSRFKFVIGSDRDMSEAVALVNTVQIPREKVWMMPQGRTPSELQARLGHLAEFCKSEGFNLTDRLHIEMWGDKKGV